MNQYQNIEIPDSHSKTIQNCPAVAAATANFDIAEADYCKQSGKDGDLNIEVKIETELRKSELVFLWLFIAILATLTVLAGYMFWKKITSQL